MKRVITIVMGLFVLLAVSAQNVLTRIGNWPKRPCRK